MAADQFRCRSSSRAPRRAASGSVSTSASGLAVAEAAPADELVAGDGGSAHRAELVQASQAPRNQIARLETAGRIASILPRRPVLGGWTGRGAMIRGRSAVTATR